LVLFVNAAYNDDIFLSHLGYPYFEKQLE
jgi:hypothetical protein